jgi:hypothetical protein
MQMILGLIRFGGSFRFVGWVEQRKTHHENNLNVMGFAIANPTLYLSKAKEKTDILPS